MQWQDYVASHLDGNTQRALARRTGIDANTLSRWITGQSAPMYERAVAFARGVGDSPVVALVIAGLITADEADMPREIPCVADLDSLTLVDELRRRIAAGE